MKKHFVNTKYSLITNTSSEFTKPQLNERKNNILRLDQYEKQGQFPVNTEFQDKEMPYIKDKFGTLCALAYLIHKSGRDDIVNELHITNNHVKVEDIDQGLLLDWLDLNGLTKSEAIRIQPAYAPEPVTVVVTPEDVTVTVISSPAPPSTPIIILISLLIIYLHMGYLLSKSVIYLKSIFDFKSNSRKRFGETYGLSQKVIFFKLLSVGVYLVYFYTVIDHFIKNAYYLPGSNLDCNGQGVVCEVSSDLKLYFIIFGILIFFNVLIRSRTSYEFQYSKEPRTEKTKFEITGSIVTLFILLLLFSSNIETYPNKLSAVSTGILYYLVLLTLVVNGLWMATRIKYFWTKFRKLEAMS